MLRLFRPAVNFRAARIAAQNVRKPYQGKAITVQRVRFSPSRRHFARNTLVSVCIAYFCYQLYDTVVISTILYHLDKEYASLSTKEKKEIDETLNDFDDSIFFPVPFATNKVQSPPYRGSDPEWAQFGKISKDKQLQKKIRDDLAAKVKQILEAHPAFTLKCGNDVQIRRYWLDIDFPYRPPPTFEQSGILWDDNGLHWAAEPIDSMTVTQLENILWPTAVAQSTWAFTSTVFKQHWSQIQSLLGFDVPAPPGPFSQPRTAAFGHPKFPSSGRQTPDGSSAVGPSGSGKDSTDVQKSNTGPSGGKTSFLKDGALSHGDDVRQLSSEPWIEFLKTLVQTWKPSRPSPPRGSIVVSGFVELETTKAFVVVDVTSYWDPIGKQFDALVMSIRRIQMKMQSPGA